MYIVHNNDNIHSSTDLTCSVKTQATVCELRSAMLRNEKIAMLLAMLLII
jgi:hypothetical protein